MLTLDQFAKLRRSLIEHEELKHFPYVDTLGKVTIGIGYNLTDRGMTDDWINHQFESDVEFFYGKLNEFPWFQKLNIDRQIALIDMSFMGWQRMLEFKEMLDCLEKEDYKGAAFNMIHSEWAVEVKSRAAQLAQVMLTGEYNV